MVALLMACLFFEIFVHVLNLHQQKRALKLCSATLNNSRHFVIQSKIKSNLSRVASTLFSRDSTESHVFCFELGLVYYALCDWLD